MVEGNFTNGTPQLVVAGHKNVSRVDISNTTWIDMISRSFTIPGAAPTLNFEMIIHSGSVDISMASVDITFEGVMLFYIKHFINIT